MTARCFPLQMQASLHAETQQPPPHIDTAVVARHNDEDHDGKHHDDKHHDVEHHDVEHHDVEHDGGRER